MQKITQDCDRTDPFLQRACELANRNNRDGAVAVIRPSKQGDKKYPQADVWIVNGVYKSPGCGKPDRFYPDVKK